MVKKVPGHLYSEWSYFVEADDIDKPQRFEIEASEKERKDLARRLEIDGINSLKADLTVSPEQGGLRFHVTGTFKANVTQICVVTMDPFKSEVLEQVEGWFEDKSKAVSFVNAKKERDVKHNQAEVEVLDESEDPEPLVSGCIDLGELVSQHLSLALDPYPHKEGVKHPYGDDQAQPAGPVRKSPFEALKEWKERR